MDAGKWKDHSDMYAAAAASSWVSSSVGNMPHMRKTAIPTSALPIETRMANESYNNHYPPGVSSASVCVAPYLDAPERYPSPIPSINSHSPTTPTETSDLDAHIQHHLASLGVLMAAVTSDVVTPETVHINTIKTHSDLLKAWHANLPDFLTLSMAGNEAYESPILLIHCAYLSSIILLTRRLHVEKILSTNHGTPHTPGSEIDEYSAMCGSAARQLATVVGMLREYNRLTRRCWLIIQSAYTASVVILLDLCTRRGRPMLESAFTESISLTVRCLEVLQHCAVFDTVASRYLYILQPIHATLSTPEPSPSQRRMRNYQAPPFASNEALLEHIIELLRTPEGAGGEGGFFERGWVDGYPFATERGEVKVRMQGTGVVGVTRRAGEDGGEMGYPSRSTEELAKFFSRTT